MIDNDYIKQYDIKKDEIINFIPKLDGGKQLYSKNILTGATDAIELNEHIKTIKDLKTEIIKMSLNYLRLYVKIY